MPYSPRLRNIISALLCMTVATAIQGCADYDEGPAEASASVTNVVTFTGNDLAGRATFDFYPSGAATPLKLVADRGLDSEVEDFRCLATYIPVSGNALASGPVTLVSCSVINDLPAETAPLERFIDWWDTTPFTVRSLWAGGPYVNLDCMLPYGQAKRDLRFFIVEVIDEATGEEMTDLVEYDAYIAQRADTGPTFERHYYLSFDLREFLAIHPAAATLRIHINNAADPARQTYTLALPRAES